jgi:hypothetical protein
MKLHHTHSSLIPSRSILRCLTLVFMLVSAIALLAPVSHGQTAPPDVPSGFLPGILSNFAGGSGLYANGSLPTQVAIGSPDFTATDSKGNVYIAYGGIEYEALYMVYGGVSIPTALANVTTNATSPVTPVAGRIYLIAGADNRSGLGGNCTDATCGEGKPLDQVGFVNVTGLAIDSQDNLYYADALQPSCPTFTYCTADVVRKVDAATSIVSTVAGQFGVTTAFGATSIGDGGPATSATLNYPWDIKLDSYGNLFIMDYFDGVARVVYSGSQAPPILGAEGISNPKSGYIYTVAGQAGQFCGNVGSEGCGNGGAALSATLDTPNFAIGVDTTGNLYIADSDYNTGQGYIRTVYTGGAVPAVLNQYLNPDGGSSVSPTSGYIYPVTGYGVGYVGCTTAGCGDGGLAANMEFGGPGDAQLYMTLDDLGNLYIADEFGYAIRKIDTYGYASTIAGIDSPTQPATSACPAVPDPAVGSCLATPSYISFDANDNLYISDVNNIWEVAPLLAQNITLTAFNPATVTYGVTPIQLAATSNSTTPITYAVTSSTPNGIGKINGSQLVVNGAGSITVDALQAQTSVYAAGTSNPETVTVDQAPLTVTANNLSLLPGQFNPSNPGFTASITGFVNGNTATTPGVYSGAPVFTTNATSSTSCGSFSITPSIGTLASTNYNFANFVPGTLTVTGTTAQTVNFPALPSAVNYGQAPIQLNATSSSGGAVTFTVVSGPGTIAKGTSTLTITGAGSIVVQAIQVGSCTYAASSPVTRTLTVNPAPLTVTGPTVTTTYGTVLVPSTFPAATITGFVGMDTESSVLTGGANYTIASTTPNAGTYPITVSLGTLALDASAAANYTIANYVNGSLIVNQASQSISFTPIASPQTYGNGITLTAIASSGLTVAYTLAGPAYISQPTGTLTLNGVGTVTVTATQAGNNNYLPAPSMTQTIAVGQAPLDVSVGNGTVLSYDGNSVNYVREQGATNPTFLFTFGTAAGPGNLGNFVNGDSDIPSVITGVPALTTTATQSSPPGLYPIAISQGTLSAANYYFVFAGGTLAVTLPGSYAMTASPTSLTIPRGQIGQATIILTPANYYQGTVTLSCGSLPANVSCVFSPATYTFTGSQTGSGGQNPAQGTVTINTSANTVVAAAQADRSNLRLAGLLIPGAFAGLFLVFARKRVAKATALWTLCALFSLGLGTLTITSCGGSSGLTTAAPGTVTLTITGSGTTPSGSSTVTATTPLTVTIQ